MFIVGADGVCVLVHDPIDLVAQAKVENTLHEVCGIIHNVLMSYPSIELERALGLIHRELIK